MKQYYRKAVLRVAIAGWTCLLIYSAGVMAWHDFQMFLSTGVLP